MNIAFISDTHGRHEEVPIPKDIDTIVHCGDFSPHGELKDVARFAFWFGELPVKNKVCIAGNHDLALEDSGMRPLAQAILRENDIVYLENEGVVIDGLKFWGSPIQPEFCNWAFQLPRDSQEMRDAWAKIPSDTSVLITHGPPEGILDCEHGGEHIGCRDLKNAVEKVRPYIHAFGHSHEGYGISNLEGIVYINAASLNRSYEYQNPPMVIAINYDEEVEQISGGKSWH